MTTTHTREHGTRVTHATTPEDRIAAFRQIVAERQYVMIDGTMIDGFTASLVVQVYDAINDANRIKFASMPAGKMGIVAYKVTKGRGA